MLTDENGKLLAVLAAGQADIKENVKGIDSKLDQYRAEVKELAVVQAGCSSRQDTRWTEHEREHSRADTRRNIADVVAGLVGGAIGAVSSLFTGNP